MKENKVTEGNIANLVNSFYAKIRTDEKLGSVFNNAIGNSDEEWKPHLARMVDFWSSVMLTSGKYHGNPMQKHKDLPSFDASLFDHWLLLFSETANELYVKEVADEFIDKSQRIAESLKYALYFRPKDLSVFNGGET